MTNGFVTKKIGAQMLGETLLEARRKKSISIKALSRHLNIKKEYLEALEAGNFRSLPADIYIRSYLETLASYLELEQENLIGLYQQERGIQKQIKISSSSARKKNYKIPKIIITPRTFYIGLVSLIVLLLFVYLWYEFSGLSRLPKVNVYEPSYDQTIKDNVITLSGQTDPDALLTINDQLIYIDSSGSFKEKIGLQQGINVIKVQATNRLGRKSTIERKIIVEKPKELAKEEKKKTEYKNLELIITIKDRATWVHITTDGEVAYSGVMLPNSRQVFIAKEKIVLSSGKASATQAIFNGKDLGFLDGEGDVIRDKEFMKENN